MTTETASAPKLNLSLANRLAMGTRLTELRLAKGLTQLEVAQKALGFSKSHAAVSRLERGVLDAVSPERLGALCAFFGTTLEGLLAECDARHEDREPEEYSPCEGLHVTPGFGHRLTMLRQAAGMSREEFALTLGHKESWASHLREWERERVCPKPDILLRIAIKMEVSAAWLITGKRAKPIRPTLALRANALQKMHGLSNQEVANLAELPLHYGRGAIHRMTRGEPVMPETVKAVATAFDVPVSWISPPTGDDALAFRDPGTTQITVPESLSSHGKALLEELGQLLGAQVVTVKELAELRATIMKRVMKDLRKNVASPVPIAREARSLYA